MKTVPLHSMDFNKWDEDDGYIIHNINFAEKLKHKLKMNKLKTAVIHNCIKGKAKHQQILLPLYTIEQAVHLHKDVTTLNIENSI